MPSLRRFIPVALCTGLFLLCVLLVWPFLESGLTDDWSTFHTAQLLAQTGHIYYNGWEAAIVGWQLYAGALFIKLFGASFTVVRSSNFLEALAAVVLVQRSLVRAGIREWNSSLGVLAFSLSPIYIAASVLFMTDLPGVLAVMLCFYACLRGVQATTPRKSAYWISFAALSNAVLGDSRQIAWLGLLIMVPCAMWLLRRRRVVLVAGSVSCLVGIALIVASVHWFNRQPYILPAPLFAGRFDRTAVKRIIIQVFRVTLDLVLFLLPLALAFVPSLAHLRRRVLGVLAAFGCMLLLIAARYHSSPKLAKALSPFLIFPFAVPQSAETTFTMTAIPIKGPPPLPLSIDFRLALTAIVLLGLLALVSALLSSGKSKRLGQSPSISYRDLLVLTMPMTLAYCAFLLLRAVYQFDYDRYLLLVLPLVIAVILRLYQDRVGPSLPRACILLLTVWAGYSVLTLHDCFSCYRAALAVANELQAAGVPRTAIDGGWEYNMYSQVLARGFVFQAGIRLPDGRILPDSNTNTQTVCSTVVKEWAPDVRPVFAIAYPTSPCTRVSDFAPVRFHTWLPPQNREAYVVRYAATGPFPREPTP